MAKTLTLRELRQNPTQAMNAVEGGESVVITRRNRPIADLVPHSRGRGATPAEFADLLDEAGQDMDWLREVVEARTEETRDVWGDDA